VLRTSDEKSRVCLWWAGPDLNRWSSPREGDVLARLDYRPLLLLWIETTYSPFIKPFPTKTNSNLGMHMKDTKKLNFELPPGQEKFLGFLCFLGAGLAGYFLTHCVVLLGA
jgi:hypothetical protein